jgi:hypothetical protein
VHKTLSKNLYVTITVQGSDEQFIATLKTKAIASKTECVKTGEPGHNVTKGQTGSLVKT